ncbi:hypothetical protein I6N90_12545 [Paenibacillus sp. GSMTC-2017]|uniref:hypothetical protein n=1 Tax=Paenibacillus sp. GSMTC-2017 TaxID=2794350 RepID=UPI0018D99294|nr:hypothetical protein [Paenibacillus sp. GSMTC-2017]MBH5318626.1 hypothetical protein [Paenibacillus sp. GSMTC-2017]
MFINRCFFIICMTILLLLAIASSALAAPFEFTITAKTAFEKMIKAVDSTTSYALTSRYAEFQKLQQQAIDWDLKISTIHYDNDAEEEALRKKIPGIDSVRITTATNEVNTTKKKYESLFELYETQKSQLRLAKAAKNKSLTSFFNAQVEVTKIAVQSAKDTIRAKEAKLKETKAAATAKMKQIRDILGTNDATSTKIKASKSTISSTNKRVTTETKVLTNAVKKGDATAALSSLMRLVLYQNEILIQKINIHGYELVIQGVIKKASTKLKSF